MPDSRPPRNYRRDVDTDIQELEQRLARAQGGSRGDATARTLFGGTSSRRGFAESGRMDSELKQNAQEVERIQDELNRARTYRREHPAERPVGSVGRPSLVYKKGGPVRAAKKVAPKKKASR